MTKSIIVCHIATSAGARFSVHADEDDLRKSLIEYNNDTLNEGEDDDQVDEDCSLSEVIETIEERETVSWEEIYMPDGFFS